MSSAQRPATWLRRTGCGFVRYSLVAIVHAIGAHVSGHEPAGDAERAAPRTADGATVARSAAQTIIGRAVSNLNQVGCVQRGVHGGHARQPAGTYGWLAPGSRATETVMTRSPTARPGRPLLTLGRSERKSDVLIAHYLATARQMRPVRSRPYADPDRPVQGPRPAHRGAPGTGAAGHMPMDAYREVGTFVVHLDLPGGRAERAHRARRTQAPPGESAERVVDKRPLRRVQPAAVPRRHVGRRPAQTRTTTRAY